jgi:gentisate 1,2-dioxygenase
MEALGTLEELPQQYRDDLTQMNLVPLWPNLRAVLPPGVPSRQTKPTVWKYQQLRPQLMKAGDLTPMEKAERRVLVLANPGHGLENMKASPAIYLGMQLLLPGEWAPSHRHTPNAVRMVVEGSGAYTTVDGEKCPMERGDLILTPTGLWHEHEHAGKDPVVWLDVLDLPVIYYSETSYATEGTRQTVGEGRGDQAHTAGGVVPAPLFERSSQKSYPMLRYPWSQVRQALMTMASDRPTLEAVQVSYINPQSGQDVQNNLGFYALMLRPGQTLTLPARSPSAVYHTIEGACEISGQDLPTMSLSQADTCVVPGYTSAQIRNNSASAPAFLFIADEAPLHRKLGVYEVRA